MTRKGKQGQLYGSHTESGKHYIYFHRNPETKEIFYIGLGKYNRCNQLRPRNRYWKHYFNKHGMEVEIVLAGLSLCEASLKERQLIEQHQPRCNITFGGETGNRKGTPVVAYYKDGREFMRFYDICQANVFLGKDPNSSRIYRCLKGHRRMFCGYVWGYVGDPFPGFKPRNIRPGKPIHQYDLDGNYVVSFVSASLANVPTRTGIYTALDRPRTYAGYFWRTYKQEKIEVEVPKPALVPKRKVICLLTGTVFESLSDAAKQKGLNHKTLSKKLNGKLQNNTALHFYEKESHHPQDHQGQRPQLPQC